MDTYTACSIIEGFSGEVHTEDEVLQAWASLIESGACWSLQGFYGRGASQIIDEGIISPEGKILRSAEELIR